MSSSIRRTREQTEFTGEEHRQSQRFPIQRNVRYKAGNSLTGRGTTLNISRTGVLFTVESAPGLNEFVELAVEWPVRLDRQVPLKLIITGKVVRSERNRVAVAIKHHEFRTLDSRGFFAHAAS